MAVSRDRGSTGQLAPRRPGALTVGRPGKVICVGLNYRTHAQETGQSIPSEPLLFGKFSSTLIGPGDPIVLPKVAAHVDAEAEFAIVVGRHARKVNAGDAFYFVAGYTVANDVSARDLQFRDGQWFRGKGFDTFFPFCRQLRGSTSQ